MDLREQLAAYAHDAWSGWMRHLFKKSIHDDPYGAVYIPPKYAESLRHQMTTPYDALLEDEKDSDRKEADRILAIVLATVGIKNGESQNEAESA